MHRAVRRSAEARIRQAGNYPDSEVAAADSRPFELSVPTQRELPGERNADQETRAVRLQVVCGEFHFDQGITCIVGPNGCGKSNVVDAVKWILGEQSAKNLRGHEMSDIIFNGSANRHSLGFAEATLTFDNSSRRLPVDGAEVAVTRRLYRSGESEYLINRKLCRLKDIREIFMDTGVGLNAYSLIEQGKIDILLQSNPQQRRTVFEEAAGISKYKARKKEALRKLGRSEQNLLRLSDIIDEVQRRLRSVKYQAGKARSWQTYSRQLKELRITHALNEYHKLSLGGSSLDERLARLGDRQAERQGQMAVLDAERSRLETSLIELDDALRAMDNELMDIRGQIAAAEDKITFNRTRIDEWRRTEQRDRKRIADLELRIRELTGRIEAEATAAGGVEGQLTALGGRLEEAERALVANQQESRQKAADLERDKARIMELVRETSQARNDISSLDLRKENLAASRDRLSRRLAETNEQLQRLAEQTGTIDSEIADLDFAIQRDRQRLQVKRDLANELCAEAESVAEEMGATKETRSGLVSRKQLLEDLERRQEGLEDGVRRVLELSRQGLFPGIRGIVADLIRVDHRYATIIEAALGEAEQYIVIERRQTIVDSLESLEENLQGRAGFLPLDCLRQRAQGLGATSQAGVVARAVDLVEVAEGLEPVAEALLGNTMIVETLAAAMELSGGSLAGMRFVTMAGETLETDGSLRLGRLTARAGLISRKSELRALDTLLADVESRIARFAERTEDVARRIHELDDEQQELRSVIYDGSTTRVDLVAQKRRLGETAEAIGAEQPVITSEIESLDQQLGELEVRGEQAWAGLVELEAESASRRQGVETLGQRLAESEARRTHLEEQRTQRRVEVAKVEEQYRGLEDRLSHLRSAAEDATRLCDEAGQELVVCGRRTREAERTILQQESLIAEAFLKKEAAARRSRQLDHNRQEGRGQSTELHEKSRQVQEELHEIEEKLHEADLEARECRLKMETLCQRIREDFDLDLEQHYRSYSPEEVDWEAIEEQIQELRGKIERLGAVNLEAIAEQEELQRRAEFLTSQRADLDQARRMLDNLIERINRESITRFNETFAQVRENFQSLFRKLFGGGKADIVLLDPEDVLESGIEVIARPPGKEPCSISLLSGGEKALTAVALLLAVFRSKPSPFCILDEVDAPLDEANNDRFNSVIKEFVKDSQFIVITHSKRTMTIGDVLYGVTMQEPGVSKKISVRFADLHKLNLDQEDQKQQSAAGA
ncbi:MAG: chromosome segregation protein SMC [Anaerolineaceae bacterium]|nr:chromosome segregation protein SMC [Anaerolineaceae bacterium]